MQCVNYNYDIHIIEGGTYDEWHQWLVDGIPMNIVGYTGIMQGRKKLNDDYPIINIPIMSDIWIADGKSGIYILDDGINEDYAGKYRMYINNEDTSNICASHKNIVGVYNAFLYNTLGEAVLNQYGIMNVQAAIVRSSS
jgi:hypothetical protein